MYTVYIIHSTFGQAQRKRMHFQTARNKAIKRNVPKKRGYKSATPEPKVGGQVNSTVGKNANNHAMSSSSGANNSTTNQRYGQPGQIYGAYAPNNYERNHLFTGLLSFGATPSARSAADYWLTAQDLERAIAEPSGLTRTPATLHSPVRIIVLNNVQARDMNPRSRQLIPESSPRFTPRVPESSPRFTAQQNMPIHTDDESRLTKDEQKTVLKKLKKEIYNPTPKKIIQRLSLYYRDNARNSSSEKNKEIDEDEKNCAICLEDFEPRQVVMLTPCSHMFHEECIVPWVKSHGQCPVCRFAISDRIRAGAVATNNNQANVTTNDL